jgi:site-specific DNA recombinase
MSRLGERVTGRNVWNRQRRDEQLLDVDDVAAGYETRQRWNDKADWVWSTSQTHEAIVSPEDFARAESIAAANGHQAPRKATATRRTYALSGLLTCGLCGRRMAGTWNNNRVHYRCRYAAEFAIAKGIDHPKSVYVREDRVTEALDAKLAELFDPDNIDATVAAMVAAAEPSEGADAKLEAARRKLADCDASLARHRAALEAGADPTIVAGWMREVSAERAGALVVIDKATSISGEVSEEAVRALIHQVRGALVSLSEASPALRAEVYAGMGLALTYDPGAKKVLGLLAPAPSACTTESVGGGT